ncbi:T9SS type A sorting domain-containing protein, partial [Flavobacterium caeni]
NIPTITCGTPTTFTNIGYGDPNYFNGFGGCINSSTQGGKEQIYLVSSSTPYSINVSNASGGVVQYLWKLASLECDNSNWTCLERKSPTELGLVANTNTIPLNVPIYLMLNAESANSTTTNVFNINCTPLGNEDFLNEPVRVYPIPVKTVLNLQFQNEIRIDKVIITDITGKKILEQNTVSTQINVENLAKGIYIIEIYSESKKFKNKFIKE